MSRSGLPSDYGTFLGEIKSRIRSAQYEALRNVPNLNYRQIALLQHAVKHAGAVYTIESHKNSHNVVRATARADLFDLVERGYLNKRKLTRRYSFEAVPDVVRKLDLPPAISPNST